MWKVDHRQSHSLFPLPSSPHSHRMLTLIIIIIMMVMMIDRYFNAGNDDLQSGDIRVGVSKNGTRCCNCYRHIQLPVEEPREKRSRKWKYQPHTKCLVSLAVLNPPEENCSNATSCNRIRWETNGLPGQAQVSKAEEQNLPGCGWAILAAVGFAFLRHRFKVCRTFLGPKLWAL